MEAMLYSMFLDGRVITVMCHSIDFNFTFFLASFFDCVSILLISSSVCTVQPRRCCRLLLKYHIEPIELTIIVEI